MNVNYTITCRNGIRHFPVYSTKLLLPQCYAQAEIDSTKGGRERGRNGEKTG